MEEIPVENYKYERQYLKSKPKRTAKPLCLLQDDDASNFTDFAIQAEVTYPTLSNGKGRTKHQYSEVTITSLFNAYIAIINSEREAIWLRYSVMLVANTIVASFLGTGFGYEAQLTTRGAADIYWICKVGGGVFFGLFLCTVWLFMTWRGWRAFDAYNKAARKFRWQIRENGVVTHEITNPLEIHFQLKNEIYKWTGIKALAIATIILFFVAYSFIVVLCIFGAVFGISSPNPNAVNLYAL